MIRGAIEIAASEFKVPIHRIKEDNVRNALKSGRIVVP